MSYDDNEIDAREEQAVERAFDFAGNPFAGRSASIAEGTEGETLARIYVELLGLLPQGLEPMQSSPEQKERLLAALHGATEESIPAPREAEGSEQWVETPAPVSPPVSASAPNRFSAQAPRPRVDGEPQRRHGGRWLLSLAAVLLLALVGVSGWLTLQLQDQKAAVARLSRQLSFAQKRSADFAAMRTQLNQLDTRLQLVTSPASETCPLRPAGGRPLAPGASGVLFVGPNHQRWYLALYGLDPPPSGRTYQLWFMVDGKPVSVATFSGKQGARIEFASDSMPHNTNAVAVTLEPAGGMPQPTGPQVLYGDQMAPLG